MSNMRVIFMGTPEFAVSSLQKIIEANYKVVAVVTAPDRPAGRGQKVRQSDVKKFAVENKLPVLQPTNLKDDDFVAELKSLKPDAQVVVAFRMLPQKVWSLPKYGTFNLHASLLPQYRGAAPINWAIMNGDGKTGVTTFFIDEKIDTGKIIEQREVDIEPQENVGSLHDKLMEIGSNLVVDTLSSIQGGTVKAISQKEEQEIKKAPKLNKENTRIDWSRTLDEIHDHIRGLSPYPVAWTFLEQNGKQLRCKIYGAHKESKHHKLSEGKIVQEEKTLKVAVKNGFIILETLQLSGKKKMKVKDLLNGFSIEKNSMMR